jgi:hypothetical protein
MAGDRPVRRGTGGQAAALVLRAPDGRALPLQMSRWCGPPGGGICPAPVGVRSAARAGPLGHRAARGRQYWHRRHTLATAARLRPAAGAGRPTAHRSRARQRRQSDDGTARTPRRSARPAFPVGTHGRVPLSRAAADAGLHVMGQWRHRDRAFVCAASPQQRLPLEGDERPGAESAACVKNKAQSPPERSRHTPPAHGDLAGGRQPIRRIGCRYGDVRETGHIG